MLQMDVFRHDKSTIFSIVPFTIGPETKPGIYPGLFVIPGCEDQEEPVRYVVGPSEHLMNVGGQDAPIRIVTPSYQIANSIVVDYLDGQLCTDPDSYPGICWVQGDISVDAFCTKHTEMFDRIKDAQRRWFLNLVRETSDDWNRYHSSKMVSNKARIAAQLLGLQPEWIKDDIVALQANKCPGCGTMNDPENAVCSNCRCILNKAKFESLEFAK